MHRALCVARGRVRYYAASDPVFAAEQAVQSYHKVQRSEVRQASRDAVLIGRTIRSEPLRMQRDSRHAVPVSILLERFENESREHASRNDGDTEQSEGCFQSQELQAARRVLAAYASLKRQIRVMGGRETVERVVALLPQEHQPVAWEVVHNEHRLTMKSTESARALWSFLRRQGTRETLGQVTVTPCDDVFVRTDAAVADAEASLDGYHMLPHSQLAHATARKMQGEWLHMSEVPRGTLTHLCELRALRQVQSHQLACAVFCSDKPVETLQYLLTQPSSITQGQENKIVTVATACVVSALTTGVDFRLVALLQQLATVCASDDSSVEQLTALAKSCAEVCMLEGHVSLAVARQDVAAVARVMQSVRSIRAQLTAQLAGVTEQVEEDEICLDDPVEQRFLTLMLKIGDLEQAGHVISQLEQQQVSPSRQMVTALVTLSVPHPESAVFTYAVAQAAQLAAHTDATFNDSADSTVAMWLHAMRHVSRHAVHLIGPTLLVALHDFRLLGETRETELGACVAKTLETLALDENDCAAFVVSVAESLSQCQVPQRQKTELLRVLLHALAQTPQATIDTAATVLKDTAALRWSVDEIDLIVLTARLFGGRGDDAVLSFVQQQLGATRKRCTRAQLLQLKRVLSEACPNESSQVAQVLQALPYDDLIFDLAAVDTDGQNDNDSVALASALRLGLFGCCCVYLLVRSVDGAGNLEQVSARLVDSSDEELLRDVSGSPLFMHALLQGACNNNTEKALALLHRYMA
ncbi:MAG: hypothetical protein MHM6MM_006063 [Cercozoa sp. M6MM]